MQLHRLRLKNFRLHADTDIQFESGITAVVGANGAGKTTLLEAIAWAFYGTRAARKPKDSIRRTDAPAREPVRVEVEFSLGEHEYRVVRQLNKAELYLDHGNAPIAKQHDTVSQRIESIVGMSRDEFFNTYFTGQKELTVMAAMGPAERGKFLSRLMGYERLRTAQELLRAQRSMLKAQVTVLERTLEDERDLAATRTRLVGEAAAAREAADRVDRQLATARAAFEIVAPRWKVLSEQRDTARTLDGQLNVAVEHFDNAKRGHDELTDRVADKEAARNAAAALQPVIDQADALQKEFEVLDRAAASAGRRRDLHGEAKAIGHQLAAIEDRMREMVGAADATAQFERAQEDTDASLQSLAERAESVRTDWLREQESAQLRRRERLADHQAVKADLTRLADEGPEGKCPTCSRVLGTEFETVLGSLTRQLEEIESEGTFLKRRIRQLQDEPKELTTIHREQSQLTDDRKRLERQLVDAHARMRQYRDAEQEHERLCRRQAEVAAQAEALTDDYDVDRHEALRRQLRDLQPRVVEATTLAARAEGVGELRGRLDESQLALKKAEAAVTALRAAVAALAFDEADYARTREAFDTADAGVRTTELAFKDADAHRRLIETQLEAVERRVAAHAERMTQLESLRGEHVLHDELDRAFEDLRQELNARLRPDLSELASGFLAELTDGRYHELELTDKYEILIMEDGLPKHVISGGEEDIANLVLRVAISQMVAERAGQPLSLLVLDEIFGGLDEDRRRNVVELLRGLSTQFPQVLLITHIEQVKHGVDHVLRVDLDPQLGCAKVTVDESVPLGEEHAAA